MTPLHPPTPATSVPGGWREAVRLRAGLIAAWSVLLALLGWSVATAPPVAAEHPRPTAAAWRLLAVRPLHRDFADLRSVTHRWPCARAGVDNYADARCDPWNRLFNYPPVWLVPARLGWGPRATPWLAGVEVLGLMAALWTLLPARTLGGSAAAAALTLSTPVMFAVERGNVDLLVFAALVLGLRATRDLSAAGRDRARAALFAALAFLKLFPIAAFAVLARSPRRALAAGTGAALVAAGIALAYHGVLPKLQANTFHEFDTNYGRLYLFATDPAASAWSSPAGAWSLGVAAALGGLAAAWGALRREAVVAALGDLLEGAHLTDLAAAGAAVFALTFLIGLNYDYRLVFLLPVFPLLSARAAGRRSSAAERAALLVGARLVLAHRAPDAVMAVVDWILFGGVCAAFGAAAARRWGPARRFAGAARAPI